MRSASWAIGSRRSAPAREPARPRPRARAATYRRVSRLRVSRWCLDGLLVARFLLRDAGEVLALEIGPVLTPVGNRPHVPCGADAGSFCHTESGSH